MQKHSVLIITVILVNIIVSACSGTPTPDLQATVQAAVNATQAAQATATPEPQPTASPTEVPSPTPLSPTNTPEIIPTLTPTPTPIPPTPTLSSPTIEPSPQETKELSSQLEEQIIGTWQFRMENQGGFEFRFLEDGSIELNVTDAQGQFLTACEGIYTLSGSELTYEIYEITEGAEDTYICPKGMKQVVKVELLGDVLLYSDEHGNEIPLIRVSAGQEMAETIQQFSERMKKDIIGTWQIKFSDGGWEYQFSDDSKVDWRVIDERDRLMFTFKGNYTLSSQKLVIEFTEVPEVPDQIARKKGQAFVVIVSGDSLYFRGLSSQEWMEAIRVSAN
jgi:hypothetical protein